MKPVAFILFVVMLFSTVVPCSLYDHCEEEACAAQCADTGDEPCEDEPCRDCSPFSICSTANEFAETSNKVAIQTPETDFPIPAKSTTIHSFFDSEYHPSLFQPPRC